MTHLRFLRRCLLGCVIVTFIAGTRDAHASAPVANAGGPYVGVAGASVTFDGTRSFSHRSDGHDHELPVGYQ